MVKKFSGWNLLITGFSHILVMLGLFGTNAYQNVTIGCWSAEAGTKPLQGLTMSLGESSSEL